MMTPQDLAPVSARVSIIERVVPSLGMVIASMSGAVGALMIFRFFNLLKTAENAGYAAFYAGTSEIEFVVGAVLIFAAMLVGIGVIVSVIRLFTTNATSSPSGVFFLLLGLLSLVAPFLIHYIMHFMEGVVAHPTEGGLAGYGGFIVMLSYIAIGAAVVVSLILLAFSFIPLSSTTGRKASTVICLILVEVMVLGLAGIFFWQGRQALAEKNKDRSEQYSRPADTIDDERAEKYVESFGNNTNLNTGDSGVEISNSGPSKTISGGVLNGRATDLPKPVYPSAARVVRAAGQVSVQVLVNEKGEVESATAVSGHPLLRAAAVEAARKAKFSPSILAGKPVKVSGVVTYTFVADQPSQ